MNMTFEEFQASKILFADEPDEKDYSPTYGCSYRVDGFEYIIDWQEGAWWECSEFFDEVTGETFSHTSLEEVEKWLYAEIKKRDEKFASLFEGGAFTCTNCGRCFEGKWQTTHKIEDKPYCDDCFEIVRHSDC